MNTKKLIAGGFFALVVSCGMLAAAPRQAFAAEDNVPLNRLLGELIVLLKERLKISEETTAGSSSSASTNSSSSGSSNATTTATSATSAETAAIVADASCATKDKPQKFPTNKDLFREKIRHLDIVGLLSAKVSVRVYDTETIIKTKMQKKEDIFKSKKRDREDIYDAILDRYGFTKAMIKLIDSFASDALKKTISIYDCRTVKTPPLN